MNYSLLPAAIKKKKWLQQSFLVLFTMLCLPPVSAQNIVLNGDFTAQGANWSFFTPATTTEAYNPETSYGGTNTTNIVGEIDQEANLRQAGIPVIAGTPYHLSFRCTRRMTGFVPTVTAMRIKVYAGTSVFLTQDVFLSNLFWNWQCQTFQFTPTTAMITLDFENITATASTLGSIIDDITITPVPQTILFSGSTCTGGSFSLTAPINSAGAQYSNYSWTGPNGVTATSPTVSFTNAQPSMNGVYTCTMLLNNCLQVSGSYQVNIAANEHSRSASVCTGTAYSFYGKELYAAGIYDTIIKDINGGCDSLIHLTLSLYPRPGVAITTNKPPAICDGDSLYTGCQPGPTDAYQWLKDGVMMPGATDISYKALETGDYSFTATTPEGCSDTSSKVMADVRPLAYADIAAPGEEQLCTGDTLSLKANNPAFYNLWTSANVRTYPATGSEVFINGIPEGKTVVELTSYNNLGCATKDSVVLFSIPCCMLFLPDAFTPNGDGINDYFMPRVNKGQKIISYTVYDRWGKIVYDAATGTGWNGYYRNGAEAQGGVYMYYIVYTCGDSRFFTRKGDVTLIR